MALCVSQWQNGNGIIPTQGQAESLVSASWYTALGGMKTKPEVEMGNAAEEITDHTSRGEINLIVLITHGCLSPASKLWARRPEEHGDELGGEG